MKIKKILLTGILGAITVTSLASCGNNLKSNNSTPATNENEPVIAIPTDLKTQLLNCQSDEEALNLLGRHSLAEVQAVLEDEEVQEKFTLSEQFIKLQSTLSSMDDSLKQIANNTNLIELMEQISSTIDTIKNPQTDSITNENTSENIKKEYNYIEFNVIKDYDYRFSAIDLNGNNVKVHKGKVYYSTDEAELYPLEISPTHFYDIDINYIENLSYNSIYNLYDVIETATKTNNPNYSNITLQSFKFDKINFVEIDEPYIFKTTSYSETIAEGENLSHDTGESNGYSQGSQGSNTSSSNTSSGTSEGTSHGTSQSESQGFSQGTSEGESQSTNEGVSQGSSENWNEAGTNENYYHSIYKMEGTNKLTLSFKIEFDKSVSLSDMLKTINLTNDVYTVELTNVYYD